MSSPARLMTETKPKWLGDKLSGEGSPKKEANSPQNNVKSSKNNANSPKKDTNSAKKDASSSKKDTNSAKKDLNSLGNEENKSPPTGTQKYKQPQGEEETLKEPSPPLRSKEPSSAHPDPSPICRGPFCLHLRQNLRKYLKDGEIARHRRLIEEMCIELGPHVRRLLWRQLNEEIRMEMAAAIHQDIVEGRRPLTAAMQESVTKHYDEAVMSIEMDVADEWWEDHAPEYHSSLRRAVLHQLQQYVGKEMDRRLIAEVNGFGGAMSGSKELKAAANALSGEFDERLRDSIREGLAENRGSILELLKHKQEMPRNDSKEE